MKFIPRFALIVAFATLALMGCRGGDKVGGTDTGELPIFSLATSEYPSWSTFVVAKKAGLINGTDTGEPGTLEKKWGVRIRLEIADYDPCLTKYGGGSVDAVCITNMDVLNPALTRNSTAILPTSTSAGGDKVIGVGFRGIENFKGQTTYGLSKSVSEYVWYRGLEQHGLDPKDYKFKNLEPSAAATAIQTGSKEVTNICVWNPFALQTLRSVKTAKVLWDSSAIPEEVIDMVVVSTASLNKLHGDDFACLICDAFYEVCRRMDDPKTADLTYKALGAEFSNLSAADMKICCTDTKFYSTPDAGLKLFKSEKFVADTMARVVNTSIKIGVLDKDKIPSWGLNRSEQNLNFSTTFMQKVVSGK
jgi:NitT/TauT family transport system substrate-binding protein